MSASVTTEQMIHDIVEDMETWDRGTLMGWAKHVRALLLSKESPDYICQLWEEVRATQAGD